MGNELSDIVAQSLSKVAISNEVSSAALFVIGKDNRQYAVYFLSNPEDKNLLLPLIDLTKTLRARV